MPLCLFAESLLPKSNLHFSKVYLLEYSLIELYNEPSLRKFGYCKIIIFTLKERMTVYNFKWFLHAMLFIHTQQVIRKQKLRDDEEGNEDEEGIEIEEEEE